MRKIIVHIILLSCIALMSSAQTDTLQQGGGILHQEKSWVRSTTDSLVIDSLSGDVIFFQDSIVMYCDSAIIMNEIEILAWGNVALVQRDTIETFSDSLSYNAVTKKSKLTGQVVLQNGEERLVTDVLYYDLNTEIADYYSGAEMTKGDVVLRSDRGRYFVSRKQAYFKSNVQVVDSTFTMWTDSMRYNLITDRANFFGPTRINQEDAKLYCENGHYNIPDRSAQLNVNAQYESDSLIASADQLFYDGNSKEIVLQGNAKFKNHTSYGESIQIVHNEETKVSVLTGDAHFISDERDITADVIEHNGLDDSFSTRGQMELTENEQILLANNFYSDPESTVKIAAGDVVWQDTVENVHVLSDSLFLDEENNTVTAINETFRPLMRNIGLGDTIWMASEIISAMEVEDSVGIQKIFNAKDDVKVLSSTFQATSNLLLFNNVDSTFTLSSSPLMWVDSIQFKADTIEILLENSEPSVLYLKENAIIIIESFPTVFDQIKGKDVTVWLSDSKIDSMFVQGNAQSVYFMKDDNEAYIGADKTECSSIMFYFEDEEMVRIQSDTKPTSIFVPMSGINLKELELSGFGWFIEKRPLVLNDLEVDVSSYEF